MDMEFYGYIRGFPHKITAYGYGWENSYPLQDWTSQLCM